MPKKDQTEAFNPTGEMWDYLDACFKEPPEATRDECALKAGLSKDTVRQWYRDKRFLAWFETESMRRVRSQKVKAAQAVLRSALKEDPKHTPDRKLFLEYLKDEKDSAVEPEIHVVRRVPLCRPDINPGDSH